MRNSGRYGPKCRVAGCQHPLTGYRYLCNRHAKRDLVHGHPEQPTITEAVIREPIERISRYMKKPEGAARVQAIVDHYCDLVAALSRDWAGYQNEMHRTGIIVKHDDYVAAEYVPKVFAEKDSVKTVKQMIAMAILIEENEHLFKSDTAALHELAYVFFRDTSVSRKPIIGSRGVRVAPVYVNRRTRQVVGAWLSKNLLYFGIVLYRAWKTEGQEREQRKQMLLKTLKPTPSDTHA